MAGRTVRVLLAVLAILGVATPAAASDPPPDPGPVFGQLSELAASGDPGADVWVDGFTSPDGLRIHRFDATTGAHVGSTDISIEGCSPSWLQGPGAGGVWIIDDTRFGQAADPADPETYQLCLTWLPFDGSDPQVTRIEMPRQRALFINSVFVQGSDLYLVAGRTPREQASISGDVLSLQKVTPDGELVTIMKNVTMAALAGGSIFGRREAKGVSGTVRIDPATGKSKPVKVGAPGFLPLHLVGGNDHVVVQGYQGSEVRAYVLDGTSARTVGSIKVKGKGGQMLTGLVVGPTTIWAGNDGTPGSQGLFWAPIAKDAKMTAAEACECTLHALANGPGGPWFVRFPEDGGAPPTMERWDDATHQRVVDLEQSPFDPLGQGGPFVPVDPLPPSPEGSTFGSPEIAPGGDVPVPFTCEGDDTSPTLEWSADESAQYALIVTDPDAAGWVHWVVTGIPAGTTTLPQGAGDPEGGFAWVQGQNDFGGLGWGGPCPPPGQPHEYVFTLYRLAAPLPPFDGPPAARQVQEAALSVPGSTQQSFSGFFGIAEH